MFDHQPSVLRRLPGPRTGEGRRSSRCGGSLITTIFTFLLGCTEQNTGTLMVFNQYQSRSVQGECPGDGCARVDLNGRCPPARNLVFSGHSAPPEFLGVEPLVLADFVRCSKPDLVVLDTCYGASDALLSAIADAAPSVLVVAAPFKLPPMGLDYSTFFFDTSLSPEKRALGVTTYSGQALTRLRLDPYGLAHTREVVKATPVEQLREGLVRRHPNLFAAETPGGRILFQIPPERFR